MLSIVADEHGDVTGLAEMYIGTMHAFCLNLLQTHVPETFTYGVLTEITQRLFIDRHSRASGLTTCPTSSPGTPVLRRYVHSKLYAQIMSILQEDEVHLALLPAAVRESVDGYRDLLGKHAYFDYTSMLHAAVTLLEDNDPGSADPARDHVREIVRYVVVDEYQDVNPLQERLIDALVQFGANLCVVGDDDQTIYQWRGSEVGNILTFAERHPGVEKVVLAENFRSSEGIVTLGQRVAAGIPDGQRLPKAMEYASHQRWSRGDIVAVSRDSPADEATWICDRILELRGLPFVDAPDGEMRGLSWSDVAVLFRSVAHDAGPLVEEMGRRGIPYVVKGLTRLFGAPEIQAVVALFRYMVGDATAAEVTQRWVDARLLPEEASMRRAFRLLDDGADFARGERWGTYNIQRLYLDVLEALGVREDTVPDGTVRAELVFYRLGKFSQVSSDFEAIHFSSSPEEKYRAFVNWLEHQAPDCHADADADAGYATPDAVTISTVHQAKGMQWPAVFVPCLRKNRFPAKRQGGLNVVGHLRGWAARTWSTSPELGLRPAPRRCPGPLRPLGRAAMTALLGQGPCGFGDHTHPDGSRVDLQYGRDRVGSHPGRVVERLDLGERAGHLGHLDGPPSRIRAYTSGRHVHRSPSKPSCLSIPAPCPR